MQSSTFKIEDLDKARTFENKHFVILSVKMNPEIGHQVFLKSIKNKKTVIGWMWWLTPVIKIKLLFVSKYLMSLHKVGNFKNKLKLRKEIKYEIYKNGRYKHKNTTYLVG